MLSIKKVLYAVLFVGCLAAFSSCNRGVGCPSNFSLTDVVTKVVKQVAQTDILYTIIK